MQVSPHGRRLASLVCTLWLALGVRATMQTIGTTPASREARTLIQSLMSPYCPGLLLSDCRSEGGRQLRAEIINRFDAGESRDSIEADLVARYGPEIRTVPSFDGVGRVAWITPGVLGITGLGLALLAIRHHMRRTNADTGPDQEVSTVPDVDADERIQDELAALD